MKAKSKKQKSPSLKKSEPNYDEIHKIQARRRRRSIAVVLSVIIVLGALVGAVIFLSGGPGTIGAGNTAPDFSLQQVTPNGLGNTITLSSHKGSVVLLEFMVSWCPVCQANTPDVESVYQSYLSSGVFVLAVAQTWYGDGQQANLATTQKFIQTYGSQYMYVLDQTGSVAQAYGVNSTPTFFVIDKAGKVSSTMVGKQSVAQLSNAIQVALNG